MNGPPDSLRQYQQQLAGFLRAPEHCEKPEAVAERPALIYAELLFNNVRNFTDKCFPVCKAVLGTSSWLELNRAFFRNWHCQTPYFRGIPGEFVAYLASPRADDRLPAWLSELAHYEWLELVADVHPGHYTHYQGELPVGDALDRFVVSTNPSLQLGAFNWPVQHIGPNSIPEPQATFLAVLRDRHLHIQFVELNQLTALLLELIQDTPGSLAQVWQQLQPYARGLPQPLVREHLHSIVQTLVVKDVLCLTRSG